MKRASVLLGVVVSLCALRGWEWSTPERLATREYFPGPYQTVIVDNHGVVWALAYPQLLNFPSEHLGWQKVTESPGWGYSACFDKGDTLWVFNSNPNAVFYIRYEGQSWSGVDTMPILSTTDENYCPVVSGDSTNGVWVGWSSHWCPNAYNRYKDGQWNEPTVIPGSNWSFEFLSITTDALGRVWFGWQGGDKGTSLEYRYNDNGVWSEQMSVRALDSVYAEKLDLAPDREGGIWAMWYVSWRESPCFIEARRYEDGEWGDIDTLGDVGSFSDQTFPSMPKIAVDAYGRAWAVWRQALVPEDNCGDIYYSFNSGQGWSTPAPVDTDPAIDQLPDIAVDGAGRVWCAWWSNRGDSVGLWASYTMSVGIEEPTVTQSGRVELSVEPAIGRMFTFRVSNPGRIEEVGIYEPSGRKVCRLQVADKTFWPGTDEEGNSLPSGVYFARLAESPAAPAKLILR